MAIHLITPTDRHCIVACSWSPLCDMAASFPDLADTSKLNGSLVMYRMDVDPVPTCPRYGKAQILHIDTRYLWSKKSPQFYVNCLLTSKKLCTNFQARVAAQ